MTRRHSNNFTLIEILIVLVVVGLVLAVATPALLEKSDQMTVDAALNDIRTAVNETALRARATGQTLTLTLDMENNVFNVGQGGTPLDNSWQPPAPAIDEETQELQRSFINAQSDYEHDSAVEWTPDDDCLDENGNVVFTFFPDGQAAAREITFTVCNRNFALQIDRITAAPTIREFID